MNLTPKQSIAFRRGRNLLDHYRTISPRYTPGAPETVVAGDLIADILFTMCSVWEYDEADIKSVAILASVALKMDSGRVKPDATELDQLDNSG